MNIYRFVFFCCVFLCLLMLIMLQVFSQVNFPNKYFLLETSQNQNNQKRINKQETNDDLARLYHPSKQAEICNKTLTSSRNLSIDELIEAVQVERRATIQAACKRIKPTTSCVNRHYIHEKNFFSRKYKLISCYIPKCGYSSWLAAMFVMEDVYTVDDYLKHKIHGSDVIMEGNRKLRIGSIKTDQAKMEAWENSLKVVTVRNPFSRVLSAYNGKMVATGRGHSYVYKAISQKINKKFRHLRHNVTERNQSDDGNATFEDFVNYLVAINLEKADPHWKPFLESCKPCDAQYDYVIKFDTLNNDMEYLKQKLNISEYHRQAVFPPRNYKTNNNLVENAFKAIPKALAQKLYQAYHKDFEIFGYEKPSWLC